MQVSLIDYTGAGSPDPARFAANVLIFTKSTRLEMSPGLMDSVAKMTEQEVIKELTYMANTIPSSWEFCSYTFLISGVTRAFTHQFVRTRTASFAQQTMRVLNVDGWRYGTGPTVLDDEKRTDVYNGVMGAIDQGYRDLISQGAAIEDARGVLPTNILTNIVAKFDLRALADLKRKRASTRTQGEYRDVMDAMLAEAVRAHPWVSLFLDRTFDKAAAELEQQIIAVNPPGQQRTDMIKLLDQLRATA